MKKTVLVSGVPGTGKTNLLFSKVDEMIEKEENIVMLDSDEEYYKKFSKKLKDSGYNLYVLNLKDPKRSNGFNPFDMAIKYYSNKGLCYEIIDKTNHALFGDYNAGSDPFWENMSTSLLTGLGILLLEKSPKDKINLGSLNIALDMVSNDDNLKNYLKSLDINDPVYVSTSGTVFAPIDTKESIISVVRGVLNTYVMNEDVMNLTSYTDDFTGNKTAIFIINREDDSGLNKLANALIEQLFILSNKEGIKYNFILDNIETIKPIMSLANVINMHGDNIDLYIATRNKEDLMNRYGSPKVYISDEIECTEKVDTYITYDDIVPYPSISKKAEYFDIKTVL